MTVMQAFSDEALAIERTLASVGPDDWDQPGLGEWNIAELMAHVVRAAVLIDRYLNLPVGGENARWDRVGYLSGNVRSMAKSVAQRARDEVGVIGVGNLSTAFADGWRASLERAVTLPAGRLMHTVRGPMELQEYAATRVFELCVHHMDLCRALGRAPEPSETALAVTVDILQRMLRSRPEGLDDDIAFVLAATGREEHPDPRLPIIS